MKRSIKSATPTHISDYHSNTPKISQLPKQDIIFESTDLADLLALNIPQIKSKNKAPAAATKTKSNKHKKKMLDKPVAMTPRDIELELANLNPTFYPINTVNAIFKIYAKKLVFFGASILFSLVLLEGLNMAAAYFFNISVSTYIILGICTLLNLTGISGIYLINKNKSQSYEQLNIKQRVEKNPILEKIRDRLCQAYNLKPMPIEIMIKPEIILESRRKRNVLKIGLPLLHKLDNQELLALLTYHFQYYTICKKNKLGHFFNFKSQRPLQFSIDTNRNWAKKLHQYPLQTLHNTIMQAATLSAIDATNFNTLVNAYEKNIALLTSFNKCLVDAKKGNLIPINAVTQILCTMENSDIRHTIECAHIRDKVKALISIREDSLELMHQPLDYSRVYPCQWLLNNSNALSNTLSKRFFLNLNFSENQLKKTHDLHQSFVDLSDVDYIQNYYAGFYRRNRSITPNLPDGNIGSLLTLKIEINTINTKIKDNATQFEALLQKWDQHITPNHIRNINNTQDSTLLKKTHLDLQAFEDLLAKKSGLCLAINLSLANPKEQQNIYNLLDAHRKGINLHRIMDSTLHHLLNASTEVNSSAPLHLRKSLQTLKDLCESLPRIDKMLDCETPLILFNILDEMPNSTQQITFEILPKMAQQLIQAVDQYRWMVDKNLTQACLKVEERLNIAHLKTFLS